MAAENPADTSRILIIIVTWNKQQYVIDLLASLFALDYPRELLDIVVVDNASSDGTVDAIRQHYPGVHLICNSENIGGTGGFNTGLRYAFEQPANRYRYLWLLDNDVVVHQQALSGLVEILEQHEDIAVAGSTMMQLDYPWRINEMGCFVNYSNGMLVLNRHQEEILNWYGRDVNTLLCQPVDLSRLLIHCQPFMDVDYVAAASLLIRADVARDAGTWRDYFIHFDDVEWCLRIGKMGHRVVVSARSLIWHLSAAAKVPTWVLYYDNRNMLDMLKTHGASATTLKRLIRHVCKKAIYYQLIGKPELAELHHQAVEDFNNNRFGRKAIKLIHQYQPNHKVDTVLMDPAIKRVLMPWSIDTQATGIQAALIKALRARPDLTIECLNLSWEPAVYPLPNAHFTKPLSASRLRRWWQLWRMRGQYDLVMQSDHLRVITLSWLNCGILFINDEGFSHHPPPKLANVWRSFKVWLKTFL